MTPGKPWRRTPRGVTALVEAAAATTARQSVSTPPSARPWSDVELTEQAKAVAKAAWSALADGDRCHYCYQEHPTQHTHDCPIPACWLIAIGRCPCRDCKGKTKQENT